MKLGVVPAREVSTEEWDGLILDESSNGEFVNSRKYLSYHGSRFTDVSVAVMDEQSLTVRSVFPAVLRPEHPEEVVSHSGTTFAGLIYLTGSMSVDELDAHIELVESYYRSNGYTKLEMRLAPSVYHLQPREDFHYLLLKKGFRISGVHLVNVLNLKRLQDEAQVLLNYKSKRRNNIRRALEGGKLILRPENEITGDIWESVTENLDKKYHARPTHTLEEINRLLSFFPERISPYAARDTSGRYAALGLVFRFKRVFHTQYLDHDHDLQELYPNLFLIHHLILAAMKEGYDYLSFGGSTEQWGEVLNTGLFKFKDEFGGGAVLMMRMEKDLA